MLWGEVNGVEVEAAKEGSRPHSRAGASSADMAVAGGSRSGSQLLRAALRRCKVRTARGSAYFDVGGLVVVVELNGGDAQTRDVRPRARSLSRPHGRSSHP